MSFTDPRVWDYDVTEHLWAALIRAGHAEPYEGRT